jgi:hypothetical protein
MTESVTGPFSEVLQAVTAWLGDVADIALPPDLHWQVLLLTLGIALAIWKIRGGHGSKNAEGRERKAGLFAYLFSGDITEATVLNIGFFFLLFGFNGSFRHYHVQFHYPHWLSKWLHSPAMHHIHHSYLPQHWDRNFAAVTSLWDRLFYPLGAGPGVTGRLPLLLAEHSRSLPRLVPNVAPRTRRCNAYNAAR